MALSDPLKVKEASGTEVEAFRVSTGEFKSVYETSDGNTTVTVSTLETSSNRKRHLARIDVAKLANNPTEESKKQTFTGSVYLIVDRPLAGYSVAEMVKLVEGLTAFLTKSNVEKILSSQS